LADPDVRIFVTGVSGLLGVNAALDLRDKHDVHGTWLTHPVALDGVSVQRVDLRDADAAGEAIAAVSPSLVLHAAAMADVDACEADPPAATAANVTAAVNVAQAAARGGARLVHLSTDQLFDGNRGRLREDAPLGPLNVYARTKADAERAVASAHPRALIVRTHLYGWGGPPHRSFSDWILGGLRRGEARRMFTDAVFCPILATDLVTAILALVEAGASGVYHVAGGEAVSKYEFGLRLARIFGAPARLLVPVPMSAVPLRARRPRDLSLSSEKTEERLGRSQPSVDEGLRRLRAQELEGRPARVQEAFA
jgi:dTDP-4-dehydrorhamnose reductase